MNAPSAPGTRLTSLDVLRGVAVLGILVMNIQSFSMPDAAYLNPTAYGDLTGVNLLVWCVGHLLVDEKMYGLLSMLFGAGILLMADGLERRGTRPGPLHYRRMGWLMLFGLLHGHLLWSGDILWCYGVSGLVAYLFRKRSPKALIVAAVLFFAAGALIFAGVGRLLVSMPPADFTAFEQENWRPTPPMIQDEIAMFQGGWLGQQAVRSESALFLETAIVLILFGWKTIGNMLLGMALMKWRVLSGEANSARYRRLTLIGFPAGLLLVAIGMWRSFAAGWDAKSAFFFLPQYNYWGAIVMDLGWLGVIVLASRASALASMTQRLAAVGRMAFTNYMGQTVLCSAIFYGNGLGLFGRVTRIQQFAIVVAVWIVQLWTSPLWLRRFAFGPLEWLWRSLTYWRVMPFRIAADS